MRIEQLEYFVDIAKTKSMNITAERAFVTQSALSKSIHKLEEELEVKLFVRSKKGVELTEAGKVALKWATIILDNIKQFKWEVWTKGEELSFEELTGCINIGATPLAYNIILPNVLVEFSRFFSKVRVNAFQIRRSEVDALFQDETIDLAIVNYIETDQGMLDLYSDDFSQVSDATHEKLFEESLYIIAHKDHPLAKFESVSMEQVLAYPIALFGEHQYSKQRFYNILSKYGEVDIMTVADNLQLIRDKVLRGEEVAFYGSLNGIGNVFSHEEHQRPLKVIQLEEKILMSYYLLIPKEQQLSIAEDYFVKIMKKFIRELKMEFKQ